MRESPKATQLREALVSKLIADGSLRSLEWVAAFRDIPRHLFVPQFYVQDRRGKMYTRSPQIDFDTWLLGVYTDTSLLTQFNKTGATSSSSQPSIMAIMLEALEVQTGDSVLEIGTGSGYNAALLCHRLGDEAVTSIDIDPTLTAQAQKRLDTVGYEPTIATADGHHGYPTRAPYTRILATVGVPKLPSAWVQQLAPDGKIVATIGHELVVFQFEGDRIVGRALPQQAIFLQMRSD